MIRFDAPRMTNMIARINRTSPNDDFELWFRVKIPESAVCKCGAMYLASRISSELLDVEAILNEEFCNDEDTE